MPLIVLLFNDPLPICTMLMSLGIRHNRIIGASSVLHFSSALARLSTFCPVMLSRQPSLAKCTAIPSYTTTGTCFMATFPFNETHGFVQLQILRPLQRDLNYTTTITFNWAADSR